MALIRPRNPLAFPGGLPGFDPTHFAGGPAMRFSAVAGGGSAGMFSLFKAGKATIGSAAPTPILTGFGPAINCPSGSYAYNTFPLQNETPAAVTFAVIITPQTSITIAGVMCNNGLSNATAGVRFMLNSLVPNLY